MLPIPLSRSLPPGFRPANKLVGTDIISELDTVRQRVKELKSLKKYAIFIAQIIK